MEDNIDWKSFDKFMKEMTDILYKKFKKYGFTWKTVDISYLINNLQNQIYKLKLTPSKILSYGKESMNTLVDMANYCYFLYSRLND